MAAQFILNLFIALLWTLFTDEWSITTFAFGYLVGVFIVFLMHRLFGNRFYLARVWSFIKLILIFLKETYFSCIWVVKYILDPEIKYRPGIFKFETRMESDWEITTLSMLLTLTPGSTVLEVSHDRKHMYIHGMDVKESKDNLIGAFRTYEDAIMEVTR